MMPGAVLCWSAVVCIGLCRLWQGYGWLGMAAYEYFQVLQPVVPLLAQLHSHVLVAGGLQRTIIFFKDAQQHFGAPFNLQQAAQWQVLVKHLVIGALDHGAYFIWFK